MRSLFDLKIDQSGVTGQVDLTIPKGRDQGGYGALELFNASRHADTSGSQFVSVEQAAGV
jgi:hypothetical protein